MATVVQVRDLVPAGVDHAKRVPLPALDNVKLPLGKDLNVFNMRLFFQLVIKHGGMNDVMDLRVMFETLMMDNRYKDLFNDSTLIRLLSEMYGWSDVSDGVKGNNSMVQEGKKFKTHVMNRLWKEKYCTFCGHVCHKPLKLTYEQARQAEQIRLPHIRSLVHVVLCKSCVSKVLVVSSRVTTMAPGRAKMAFSITQHLPCVSYNGGKWWLRSSITRCIESLDQHVGDIDEEIEEAKKKLSELKVKKQIGENYKIVLDQRKPADYETLFGHKKRKTKPEDDEEGEEDMHKDKRVVPTPEHYDAFRGYYNWRKDSNVEPVPRLQVINHTNKNGGYTPSSSSSSSSSSAYYTPINQDDEDEDEDDSGDDLFASRSSLRPATSATPAHPPFTPSSPTYSPSSPIYPVSSSSSSPSSPTYSPSSPIYPVSSSSSSTGYD